MLSACRPWLHRLMSGVASALPTSCALCGCSGSEALCGGCRAQVFARPARRCACCAVTLPAGEGAALCGECLRAPPSFDATLTATDYLPPVDRLVTALKFGARLELAPLFAQLLLPAAASGTQPDLMTVVPLGRQRLVERGFNQALEIARPLARAMHIPLRPQLLARQRETLAQSLLHPDERHRNILGAFVVPAAEIDSVRGRHVAVVDDVMTTGRTLEELAATLKRFGAARVTNIVFARTPLH